MKRNLGASLCPIASLLCHAKPVGQEYLCCALRLLALRPGPPTQSPLAPWYAQPASGPSLCLSLAVSTLALRPFPAAPLMPASAASVWRLYLSFHLSPFPPAGLVPPGGQLPVLIPALEASGHGHLPALASLGNRGPALALLLNPRPALALLRNHLLRRS